MFIWILCVIKTARIIILRRVTIQVCGVTAHIAAMIVYMAKLFYEITRSSVLFCNVFSTANPNIMRTALLKPRAADIAKLCIFQTPPLNTTYEINSTFRKQRRQEADDGMNNSASIHIALSTNKNVMDFFMGIFRKQHIRQIKRIGIIIRSHQFHISWLVKNVKAYSIFNFSLPTLLLQIQRPFIKTKLRSLVRKECFSLF